jgi:hypothetical protein
MNVARWHQTSFVIGKSDHLGKYGWAGFTGYNALRTHWHTDATGFQHQSSKSGQGTAYLQRGFLHQMLLGAPKKLLPCWNT